MPMTKTCTSTQNEIIRYVYNETSSSENVFIEESIIGDDELLNFYLDCIQIKDDFTKIKLLPKDKTINNILEYSKNFRPTIFS
jgi:hypothetical protein